MTKKIGIVVVASLLAACGAGQKPAEPPPPVEDTAFRDMAGAMDKARAVEGTMQERKQEIDRTLEHQENPTAQ